jgi:phosphohistidine swiveling domain-containing protein
MSFTMRVTQSASEGSTSFADSTDYTCESIVKMAETIASDADGTLTSYAVGVDVDGLLALAILSDQAITIYVNDASDGSPTATIALVADVPFIWQTGDDTSIVGTTDWSVIYVNNNAGVECTLNLMAGSDS